MDMLQVLMIAERFYYAHFASTCWRKSTIMYMYVQWVTDTLKIVD